MIRINSTLLKALFEAPSPQPKRQDVGRLYSALLNRIFPIKEYYIDYLKAQTIDKQYEYASRIIQSLCFFSNFPPADGAIQDVLLLEQSQKKFVDKRDNFIPRDHYLHIVNLYMLGIYVFFYNTEFYDRICAENSFERQENMFSNSKVDRVKDFISSWKYFCLYHDVGYSAELVSKKGFDSNREALKQSLKDPNSGFGFTFQSENSKLQCALLSSIEIVSKIIATQYFIDDDASSKNNINKIIKRIDNLRFLTYEAGSLTIDDATASIIEQQLNNSHRLVKVVSNQCLKFLLPVFGEHSIIVLGLHKGTGKMAFASYWDNSERKTAVVEEYKKKTEMKKLLQLPDILLFDDFALTDYELQYYVNKQKKTLSLETLIDSATDLDNVFVYSKPDLTKNFLGVNDEESFLGFEYAVYSWVKERIDQGFLDSDLQKHLIKWHSGIDADFDDKLMFDNNTEFYIASLIQHTTQEEVDSICGNYFLDYLKSKRTKSDNAKAVEDVINNAVNVFCSDLGKIAESNCASFKLSLESNIRKNLDEKFKNIEKLLKLFSTVFKRVFCLFNTAVFEYNYDYGTVGCNTGVFLNKCIEQKAKDIFKKTPTEIVDSYNMDYGLRIDHGFSSAQYSASVFGAYQSVLKGVTDKKDKHLLSTLFSISGDFCSKKAKYTDDYDHVFSETVFAIFSHNIYPAWFDRNSGLYNFKFSITDAFTYFSMTCDCLQQWNRPHSIWPAALIERPNQDASEDYNIIVNEKGIYISNGNEDSEEDRVGSWIAKASSYLKDASAILKKA